MNTSTPQRLEQSKFFIPRIIMNHDGLYEGDLTHYLKAFFYHGRNVRRGYHNFRHSLYVVCTFFEACQNYLGKPGEKKLLSPREVRNGLIAALFHDFNHSGCVGEDDLEIERAVRGFRKHAYETDIPEFASIEQHIRATKYPYETDSKQLCLVEQIMRDSDLSQGLSPVWMQQILFGLGEEMNKSPIEMLRLQIDFLSGLQFSTEWGQKTFGPEKIRDRIEEVKMFLTMLS